MGFTSEISLFYLHLFYFSLYNRYTMDISKFQLDQPLSKDQEVVLNHFFTKRNCFLRGDAGTGKSFILEYYARIQSLRGLKVLKCAPTGLASTNFIQSNDNEIIGTIHRVFHIGTKNPILKKNAKLDLKLIKEEFIYYDIIIVDEISMCRIDLFTYFSRIIERVNKERAKIDKPKIQLIVSGDFYQLPPVAKQDEKVWLRDEFGSNEFDEPKMFAFESEKWNSWNFKVLTLTNNHRQTKDEEFKQHLNAIREANDDKAMYKAQSYFNTKCLNNKLPKDSHPINLYAKNSKVDEINRACLALIDKDETTISALPDESIALAILSKEIKEEEITWPKKIILKPGAQIMFTKNDTYQDDIRFYNGDLATVIECDDDHIKVRLHRNNDVINVSKIKCKNRILKAPEVITKVKKNKQTGLEETITEIVQEPYDGFYRQFPIKLAYAITIHKAQGQTFDYVNIDPFDVSQFHQLYVALSRVKCIDNLRLENKIHKWQFRTSKVVNKFYKDLENNVQFDIFDLLSKI